MALARRGSTAGAGVARATIVAEEAPPGQGSPATVPIVRRHEYQSALHHPSLLVRVRVGGQGVRVRVRGQGLGLYGRIDLDHHIADVTQTRGAVDRALVQEVSRWQVRPVRRLSSQWPVVSSK
eukprot:scaffold4545_cov58-Phaeocystis_antarctica.AAC.2